jgi:putative Holliday junction resolvase
MDVKMPRKAGSASGGKILGIDFGEKRIGLAISDESQTFARELNILSPKKFFNQLNQLISDEKISKIVLGWPLNMSGQETEKTREVENFKLQISKKTQLPVEVIDERLSSVMAKNLPGGKKDVDSLAAQILLQNYLDKNQ